MYFLVNNVLAFTCAWCISRLACPEDDSLKRFLISMIGFVVVVVSSLQLLGAVGQLSNSAVTALMATVLVALLLFGLHGGAFGKNKHLAATREGTALDQNTYAQAIELIAATLFVAVVGAAAIRSCFGGTEFLWDDLTYHATAVAHWVRDHRFPAEAYNAQAYYPKVAELLSLWWVLPFGSDAYASLAGLYWLVLLATTVLFLSRRLGVSWAASLMAATLCVAAFKSVDYARSFSAVDLATYSALLASAAIAVPGTGPGGVPLGRREAITSGAAAGIAMGAKLFALPGVALLFAWWCIADRSQDLRARLTLAMWYAAGAALLGSYWYVRAFVLTGNPIFPADIGPFEGMQGFGQSGRLFDALVASPNDPLIFRGIASAVGHTGLASVLVAGAGYIACVVRMVRQKSSIECQRTVNICLLFLLGSTYILLYPLMPFSGYRNSSGAFIAPVRYVAALVVPIGVILFICALDTVRGIKPTIFAFGVLAIVISWSGSPEDAGIAMAIGTSALLVAHHRTLLPRTRKWTKYPATVPTVTVVLLAILSFWLPQKQRLTDANLFQVSFGRPLSGAWRVIEANAPADSRITWGGPRSYIYYPLFGRNYRLEPVRTRSDGNLSKPFAEEARQAPLASIDFDRIPVGRDTYVENLRSSRIDYVLMRQFGELEKVSPPEMVITWRKQIAALRSSERAHLVYDDGGTSLWRLDGPGG